MTENVVITGEMAEKAFVLCDAIEYKGETLYDLIFTEQNDFSKILMGYTPEKRKQFQIDAEALQKCPEEKMNELGLEIMNKYPEIYKPSTDLQFKIKKMLNLNSDKAKALAKAFDGKTYDIFEAVEVCLKWIRFLKNHSELPVSEVSGSERV